MVLHCTFYHKICVGRAPIFSLLSYSYVGVYDYWCAKHMNTSEGMVQGPVPLSAVSATQEGSGHWHIQEHTLAIGVLAPYGLLLSSFSHLLV